MKRHAILLLTITALAACARRAVDARCRLRGECQERHRDTGDFTTSAPRARRGAHAHGDGSRAPALGRRLSRDKRRRYVARSNVMNTMPRVLGPSAQPDCRSYAGRLPRVTAEIFVWPS